jgi:hypothetical protein
MKFEAARMLTARHEDRAAVDLGRGIGATVKSGPSSIPLE